MTQHDDNASPWQLLHPISDDQAAAARLVIAGAAQNADDARLLMQACGLVHDPPAERFIILPNGHVKRGPNALRSGQTPSHSG